MEILLITLIPIVLWVVSIQWLAKWKKFWSFFIVNLALVISYLIWLTQSELNFLGTDPYGLGQFFLIVSVLFGHILTCFIFAFLKRKQLLKQAV